MKERIAQIASSFDLTKLWTWARLQGFEAASRGGMPVLVALAVVLALIPVLLVPIPGFVDAPAHMARHHILAVASSGGPLSGHFAVDWYWLGNLGEDIPAALIGPGWAENGRRGWSRRSSHL
ncbi:hypothetical protein [Novosphingobium sp. M1R2S20]|uniref:Uncharacterized protein n=1 Tax=Novosphingobium rhizovicinum TaxID=3228928 RepID=A0ABV3R811_9SPHN